MISFEADLFRREIMAQKRKDIIAITLGDINGVGPEVVIKALSDQRIVNHLTPVIIGSTDVINFYRKRLKIDDFNMHVIQPGQEPHPKRINVVECWSEKVEVNPGEANTAIGELAYQALEKATDLAKTGKVDAIVTGPINKATIQSDEFKFPGHTEYFANKFEGKALMFMISGSLRVAVATGHVSIKDAPALINRELIEKSLKNIKKSLIQDFGIAKPKIAVMGLNPHAGEDGLLGREELDVILPVISNFKENGDLVFGPFPADGFFGTGSYKNYDAVLAMYHDQGLVPFKSLSFGEGVNFSANLSVVRTSPDHGTAYDIAGKNLASASSMREAIYLAHDILGKRAEFEDK